MRYTATEIITIRKSLFLTQTQFTRFLGTHQTMVSQWEIGKYQPSRKWTEIIQQKLKDVKRRLEILNALYNKKPEAYFVLFDSDLVDYAAKQILFTQKIRAGQECYLVKFNRQSYQNHTSLDHIVAKPLNEWAKWYHSHGEKKPKTRKQEYPWLSEWEA